MDFFVPSLKKSGESWRVSDGNLLCAAARATSGCSHPCDGEMKKPPAKRLTTIRRGREPRMFKLSFSHESLFST